jgi:hypothetical protein
VDDVPDTLERTDCFRAKQPMRIGDEAYRFQWRGLPEGGQGPP